MLFFLLLQIEYKFRIESYIQRDRKCLQNFLYSLYLQSVCIGIPSLAITFFFFFLFLPEVQQCQINVSRGGLTRRSGISSMLATELDWRFNHGTLFSLVN